MFRRIPLAWLNLIHNRGQFLTSLSSVAFAVVLMFMFTGFKNALYDSQAYLLEKLKVDIVIVSTLKTRLGSPETFDRTRLYQAQNIDGIEAAYPFYIQLADWKNPQTQKIRTVRVLAFNPSHSVLQLPEVEAQVDRLHLLETVLLDQKSRPEVGRPEIGKTTELGEESVQVIGDFVMGTDFSSADGNVITSDRTFFTLFTDIRPDQWDAVDVGLLQAAPNANIPALVTALKQYLPDDIVVLSKEDFILKEKGYWQNNTSIGFVFSLLTSMGFIVGIVLVYQILYTDIADHWSEYATLKAIGYTNTYLLKVVVQEAILLSILGFIPGFCISILLYNLTADATGLLFEITPMRVMYLFLATNLMCLVSGAIAVQKVQSTDPAEMFG